MAARLATILLASPIIGGILDRWSRLTLPDCWISGSALAQTVWNEAFARPPGHGLADVDLVYFDPDDLTLETEAGREAALRTPFADLPVRLDVKNQARVHHWYAAKFGYPIAAYRSVKHAISTFPTTAGAVAVRPERGHLSIHAPFGLSDLMACTVRTNKAQVTRDIYGAKVTRWVGIWPELTIVAWDEGAASPLHHRSYEQASLVPVKPNP